MATLTNTKIKDTYDGLLKTTNNEAIAASGVTLIEDGLGNASALSVGRSGNGVTITGSLNATLATAAQPNITSVGTLSSLAVGGAISLQNTSIPSAGTARIFSRDTNSYLYLQTGSGNQVQFLDGSQNTLALFNPSLISFSISNSEAMRIDSSGNVGIGVTPKTWSVGTALEVARNGSAIWSNGQGETNIMANIYYDGGYKYAATGAYGARINVGNTNGNILFYTDSSSGTAGSTSGATERMRITSGGYLKASDNAGYNIAGPFHEFVNSDNNWATFEAKHSGTSPFGEKISFTGASPNDTTRWFLNCSDSTTQRLYIWSNGNVQNSNNSYGAISDIKLKENIVDASPKLDDLLQVKIRNYNLIGDDKKQLGVVAQELEEVFPSMIDESPDFEEQEVIDEEGNVTKERVDLGTTTKSVKYSVFVPMLIKAMQEQQEIINDLKARIETLENK